MMSDRPEEDGALTLPKPDEANMRKNREYAPEIPDWAWEQAHRTYSTDRGLTGIARAILKAREEAFEWCAAYIEGKGGVIPGTAVFAPLVSRNNMPDMSGDPRARLRPHDRRAFDDATDSLASAIRQHSQKGER